LRFRTKIRLYLVTHTSQTTNMKSYPPYSVPTYPMSDATIKRSSQRNATQRKTTQSAARHRIHGNWTTRGYTNSRITNSRTGHLADWSTSGLDKSRTGQLVVSQMPLKERKLSTQSRWWHPRVVQSVSWRIRELSSNRIHVSRL